MKIACIDKDVNQILESGYYTIPRFQRSYSWEKDEVEDFWNDTIADSDSEYFIGSMVVYKNDRGIYGIVDGQQRLTTITMILCAIRNILNNEGFEGLADAMHQLVEKRDINNNLQYILQTETSYPYLQEEIQKYVKGDSHCGRSTEKTEERALEESYKHIFTKMEGSVNVIKNDPALGEEKKKEELKKKLTGIRDRILKLKLIFIELDTEDDAYLIFETLNTRGKNLQLKDLVKSHLTKLIKKGNVNVDRTKDKWLKMVELMESATSDVDMDNFIHHYWLSKYDYTSRNKIYRALRKQIKKNNAIKFLAELENDAPIYRSINDVSFQVWDKQELSIKRSLYALNLFKVRQDLPMLLAVMRDYRAKNLRKKHVEKVLKAIENFHFIFTAITSQRSSGGIASMYASYARRLSNGNNNLEKIKLMEELISKLKSKIPSYQEFEANFVELGFSRLYAKNKRLVRYVLDRLDSYNRAVDFVDYDKMTIEHISPESQDHIPLSDSIIANIGNLMLIDEETNNKVGNKGFARKVKLFKERDIKPEQYILDQTAWGREQIEERAKQLARIAYEKVWRI